MAGSEGRPRRPRAGRWRIALVLLALAPVCLSRFGSAAAPATAGRARALEAITRANLGLAYLEEESAAKAAEEFKKIIELFPREPLGHANLGLAQFLLGRPEEAERFLRQALLLDGADADLHVLLGEILQGQAREEEARASYERAVSLSPAHVRARYKLARISQGENSPAIAAEHLGWIARERPENLPALLELSLLLLRQDRPGEALKPLGRVAALFEGVEGDFLARLKEAIALAESRQSREAATRIQIFTNLARPSPLFRQGAARLSGPNPGLPPERFSRRLLDAVPEAIPRAVPVKFRDATAQAGLPTSSLGASAVVFLDADGDGRLDLFICAASRSRLFLNRGGRFVDRTERSGLKGLSGCAAAAAADFDNDGDADLYLSTDEGDRLYSNDGSGRFADVTSRAGLGGRRKSRGALFVDLDQDGDLDLLVVEDDPPPDQAAVPVRMYRNAGDGTFTEITRSAGMEPGTFRPSAAASGDLDDDGRLDFAVAGGEGIRLYANLSQGRFKDIAREAGLAIPGKHQALALGDYNNDGRPDLFLAGSGPTSNRLFRNLGGGRFAEAPGALALSTAEGAVFSDVRFADFDNDGHLDLLLVGGASGQGPEGRTLRLYRNNGRGGFIEASDWLPAGGSAARQAVAADYDDDGDLDILVVSADGRVRLLRNDGGNRNRWLKVRLKGLNVGDSKNNLSGLGAKVEIKAGPLYAARLVEGPVTHFGLGTSAKADLLRVIWPNGHTDTVFRPAADHTIQAEQQLKGSCPFLYTWDGERYAFVTDIHWRNLLGMVLADGSYAPPDPARDYFKIPGDKLRARDGLYSMQITEELWETTFLDQTRLFVVDHPQATEIFVNEAFIPPPFPPFVLYGLKTKRPPLAALDDRGNDILPLVRRRDGRHFANATKTAYQGYMKERSFTLDLGDLSDAPRILLFLHGWLRPFDTTVNVAVSQRRDVAFSFPRLEVIGADGRWRTAVENIGAPSGKNKTVVVDLSGKFPTKDFRVRITTTLDIAWDEIFYSTDPDVPVRMTPLSPRRAHLHERGFSRSYRETPGGPALFDYARVTQEPKWRPMEGPYTRYGEVGSLLLSADDMYAVIGAGDELTVEFDASKAPPLQPGWTRDFIIYTEGWIKEADLNGALSRTVEPLVFHGMSRYPYGSDERYPDDEAHREFLRNYLTRLVKGDAYREYVKRYVSSSHPETVTPRRH